MFVDGTINLFCVIRFAAPFLILYFPPRTHIYHILDDNVDDVDDTMDDSL